MESTSTAGKPEIEEKNSQKSSWKGLSFVENERKRERVIKKTWGTIGIKIKV